MFIDAVRRLRRVENIKMERQSGDVKAEGTERCRK